jgi:prevent-host-death family protein
MSWGEPMKITASKLRENIYQILDEAIATGTPVEVVRKGTVVRIVPEKRTSKLTRLKKRSGFKGNPDDIIGMDWSKEWTEIR